LRDTHILYRKIINGADAPFMLFIYILRSTGRILFPPYRAGSIMVLESSVTAVCDNSLPFTVAPVARVISE
jgi:hypothetical protein